MFAKTAFSFLVILVTSTPANAHITTGTYSGVVAYLISAGIVVVLAAIIYGASQKIVRRRSNQ
jgi:hypothetical protein